MKLKPDQKPFKLTKVKNPKIEKLVDNWDKTMGPFEKSLYELIGFGKVVIPIAREVYKQTDKMLKDKSLSKEEKAELLELRKRAYSFTMEVKKLSLI